MRDAHRRQSGADWRKAGTAVNQLEDDTRLRRSLRVTSELTGKAGHTVIGERRKSRTDAGVQTHRV